MKEVIISEYLVKRFEPRCRICNSFLHIGDKAQRRGRKKIYYICENCVNKFGKLKNIRKRKNWTEEEIKILQKNHKILPYKKIAEKLKRSVSSIQGKLAILRKRRLIIGYRNFRWTKKEYRGLERDCSLRQKKCYVWTIKGRRKKDDRNRKKSERNKK